MALLLQACASEAPVMCPPPLPREVSQPFDGLAAAGAEEIAASWPGEVELAALEGLRGVDTPTRRGAGALRFQVDPGDVVNAGARAELAFDAGDREGVTAHYAWSLQLAPDWPLVDRVRDPMGRPNWQILAQFHDQPDCLEGETWETYPGAGASPPIAVQHVYFDPADPDVAEAMAEGVLDDVVGFGPEMLERPALGLLVGAPDAALRAVVPVEPGTWTDLGLRIHWSQGAAGVVEWWVDGESVVTVEGPNMLNAAPHYFKVGLYRNPDITPTQALFVDEVFITHDDAAMESFRAALAESR